MGRARLIGVAGVLLAAVGLFLWLRADALATDWSHDSAWGPTTDPVTRQRYTQLGLLATAVGAALAVLAAWRWVADGRGAGPARFGQPGALGRSQGVNPPATNRPSRMAP